MQRYHVTQFNTSAFIVWDGQEQREYCVCSNSDGRGDAKERAEKIAALLNGNDSSGGKKSLLQFLVEAIRQI